jgi:hypothetical protein
MIAARRSAHRSRLDRIVGAAETAPSGRMTVEPRDQFFAR